MKMEYQEIKQKWNKKYENVLKNIEKKLTNKREDSRDLTELSNWLISNDLNLDITTEDLSGYLDDPFKTEYLLDMLSHAMIDDGDVSFINVKLEGNTERVFLAFGEYSEKECRKMCLKENEIMIRSFINSRESIVRFHQKLKEEHPEKYQKMNHKNLLTEEDFVFEVHQDAKKFMQDCENLKKAKKEKSEELSKKITNLQLKK